MVIVAFYFGAVRYSKTGSDFTAFWGGFPGNVIPSYTTGDVAALQVTERATVKSFVFEDHGEGADRQRAGPT